MPTPIRVVCSLALVGSAACSEFEVTSPWPADEDKMCDPQATLDCPALSADKRAGTSTALLVYGNRYDQDQNALKAMGAPGTANTVGGGEVHLYELERSTGLDGLWTQVLGAPTVPRTAREPLVPATYPSHQFGWSLLDVDVRSCNDDDGDTIWENCGRELLVGAPGNLSGGRGGAVFWYRQESGSLNTLIELGGQLRKSPAPGDHFGYALAAPDARFDPAERWNPAPASPPWIAVGAPGADKVFVIPVDPAAANPFAGTAQVLVVPHSMRGFGFGKALAVGDFDGDGAPDLAVGAPDLVTGSAIAHSRVYVYRGIPGGLVDAYRPLILDGVALGPSLQPDGFGTSVAAGAFWFGAAGDALLVGAPYHDMGLSSPDPDQYGGVCAFSFTAAGAGLAVAASQCETNPFFTIGPTDRFGYRVAVGNFESVDAHGLEHSAEAYKPEIAVSRPGHDGDAGEVTLFRTDDTGILELRSVVATVQDMAGPVPGAQFGAALSVGYASRSAWEDLVIGSPTRAGDDGGATLTRANDLDTCATTTTTGVWTITDSEGTPRRVRIWSNPDEAETHLVFDDPFHMDLFEAEGEGPVCTVPDEDGTGTYDVDWTVPPGSEIVLSGAWTCGATTHTWVDADVAPLVHAIVQLESFGEESPSEVLIDITMTVTPGATPDGDELSLHFDLQNVRGHLDLIDNDVDRSCRTIPFEGAREHVGVCEIEP